MVKSKDFIKNDLYVNDETNLVAVVACPTQTYRRENILNLFIEINSIFSFVFLSCPFHLYDDRR